MRFPGRQLGFQSACLIVAAAATPAYAQAAAPYNLPSQSLGLSLRALASRGGVNIAFDPAVVRGHQAAPLKGTFSVDQALSVLLKGSGLTMTRATERSYIVIPAAKPKKSQPAVQKIAQTAVVGQIDAQPTEPTSTGTLEEIIVTAQKREASLQDTPIAISVLSQQAMEDRGIRSLNDFVDGGIPSLRIAPYAGRASALVIGIRGIVPYDSVQVSRDTSVGIYLDGVFLGRVQGLGTELMDLERIEVLKGPQGTLFGRNAVGGAVSIISKKPSGELGLRAKLGVSNYDGLAGQAHLDLPAMANVSLKLDGVFSRRDGTVDNPLAGQADFRQYQKWGVHTALLWEPTANFSARYDYDHSHDASTPNYNQLLERTPGGPPISPLVKVQPERAKAADIGVVLQPSVGEVYGHALHLNWRVLPSVELSSISSYRNLDQSQYDNSGAHLAGFRASTNFSRYAQSFVKQKQWSQEFQLVGSIARLNYVVGLYYYREKGEDSTWAPNTARWNADGSFTVFPAPVGGPFPDRASNARATSKAVFGQLTWTPPILEDRLHLTGGARYTSDRKRGALTSIRGVNPNLDFAFASDRVDPSATAAFDINRNVNIYAKWGRAYRAGGANSRSIIYRPFSEEVVETTEIGLKSELFDKHVRLNLAAFHTDYSNLQMDFIDSTAFTVETLNTDRPGTIRGFEADVTIKPADPIEIGFSYAYTDVSIPPQLNPYTGLTEATFSAFTPKNAASAYIDARLPLGSMSARLHLDANAADGYHSIGTNSFRTDPSFIVNGRFILDDINLGASTFQVSLWSRNLFNEQHLVGDTVNTEPGRLLGHFGYFNEPRTYGVDASVRF